MLRDYAARGFALVTTEAGLPPLVSEWRAVDAWGLNDQYVAHHTAASTRPTWSAIGPRLIVFHAYFSPRVVDHGERVETRSLGRPWYRMVMTLKGYAGKHGYVLAACFGRNEWDTHYYYVRRGFPQGRGDHRAAARSTTTGTASPRSTWRRRTRPDPAGP